MSADPIGEARRALGRRRQLERDLTVVRGQVASAIAACHEAGYTYAQLGRELGLSRARVEAMEKQR